jgi:hypothetical protein
MVASRRSHRRVMLLARERSSQMSIEESIQNLKGYAENFVASVKKKKGVTLDYTVPSLVLASNVALDYGEIYRSRSELKDPRVEIFFAEAVYQLTGYFGEVYCRHFGASWIIKDDPDDVLIQIGRTELPLYRDACDTVRLGNGALTRRFHKVEQAARDLLRAAPSEIFATGKTAPALENAPRSVQAGIEEAAAMAVQDVKAMLKQDLDGTPATFPLLEEALLRLRAMISSAPEQKSAIVKAAVKKYGAYLGQAMRKECAAVWHTSTSHPAAEPPLLNLGIALVSPHHMIEAVLEGKVLPMGERTKPVATVAEFFDACLHRQVEWIETLLHGPGNTNQSSVLKAMSDDPGLAVHVYRYCSMALTTARIRWNLFFDFSPDSVQGLEGLLSKMWDLSQAAAPNEKASQSQVGTAVAMYGAYLGEVIRRAIGGKWVIAGSTKRPVLRAGENTIDPYGHINARLLEGPSNNTYAYFKKVMG